MKRNPQHNAAIESFFSTLRFALLTRTRFAGPDEADRVQDSRNGGNRRVIAGSGRISVARRRHSSY